MGLNIGGNSGDGIFTNTRTIMTVTNLSDQYPDACVELVFEPVPKRDGGEWTPRMRIFGKYNRKGTELEFGSVFKIARLVEKIGLWKGSFNPDGTIPDSALESLIGKQCVTLDYPGRDKNGEARSQTYQLVAALEERVKGGMKVPGAQWLRDKFDADVAGGYIKDFAGEGSQDFPSVSTHAVTPEEELI
jgi:hypothetical protein